MKEAGSHHSRTSSFKKGKADLTHDISCVLSRVCGFGIKAHQLMTLENASAFSMFLIHALPCGGPRFISRTDRESRRMVTFEPREILPRRVSATQTHEEQSRRGINEGFFS